MVGPRRRQVTDGVSGETEVGDQKMKVEEQSSEQPLVVLDESDSEVDESVKTLRQRWELASVLNFLSVFEPIIGKVPKFSAEEIEAGLVEPDNTLAQLHIKLLKGIPPVSKALESSDVWVTELRKKLNPWWPWARTKQLISSSSVILRVAEGKIPLKAANGEEKSRYKKLKPVERLLILKALCEVRLEQDDAVSFVNDSLKDGAPESSLCKEQVAVAGNEASYWYEANPVIGHRLYKAIKKSDLKKKDQEPATTFQWETLATNLEEFCLVAEELASSKVEAEVSLSTSMKSDMIPVLQKLQKRREMALKKKERKNMLMNSFRSSHTSVSLRSCRSRRTINYRYDDYDRAITAAIRVAERESISEEVIEKDNKQFEVGAEGNGSIGKDSDSGNGDDDGDDDGEYNDSEEDSVDDDGEHNDPKEEDSADDDGIGRKPRGVRWSKRLARETMQEDEEVRQANTKNFMRQRPVQNSALDSIIVPDSDEES